MKHALYFIVVVLAVTLIAGCAGYPDKVSPFVGVWKGTWSGTIYTPEGGVPNEGTAEIVIDKDGEITGTVRNETEDLDGTLTGKIKSDGSASGTIIYPYQISQMNGTLLIGSQDSLVGILHQSIGGQQIASISVNLPRQ